MRISVPTAVLLRKAQAFLAAEKVAQGEALAAYKKDKEKFNEDVRKYLRRLSDAGVQPQDEEDPDYDWMKENNVSFSRGSRNTLTITIPFEAPQYPRVDRNRELWQIKRDVNALQNSNKDSLSVGPGDHLWRYMNAPEEGD